jgi:hypothetical protein
MGKNGLHALAYPAEIDVQMNKGSVKIKHHRFHSEPPHGSSWLPFISKLRFFNITELKMKSMGRGRKVPLISNEPSWIDLPPKKMVIF